MGNNSNIHQKCIQIFDFLEPSRMEIQAKWCPIAEVVPLEVVREHSVHILAAQMRRTRVHHAAHILAHFQLVHNQLPNARITPRRAILIYARAAVRHLVVQGVGPQRRIRMRRNHGWIVHEAKLLHHEKLSIPADAQKGYSHATNLLHSYRCELIDYIRLANHLIEPILNCGILGPPHLWATMPLINKSEISILNNLQADQQLTLLSALRSRDHRSKASAHTDSW